MSRLLTLLLLYKAGYEVGRFISIEKLTLVRRGSAPPGTATAERAI
jgi:hypothetical protein